jgi:hypothetical protein
VTHNEAIVEKYIRAASALLDLPIRAEDWQGVLAAAVDLESRAKLLMEFALPIDIAAEPRFVP